MIRFLHNGHHPQVWGCLTQHSQSGTGMIGGIFSCSSHWDVWQWLKLPMSRMLWQSLMMDWRNKTHRLWVILYYIILCYIMLYYMQTYGRSLIVTSFPFCFKPSSRECEHIKHAYVYIYIYLSFWDIQKYLSFHCPTFMPCNHWLTQWSLDIARLACDKSNHTQLGYDKLQLGYMVRSIFAFSNKFHH